MIGIGPVGLGSAQGIIVELLNEDGFYGAEKDACIRKLGSDRLIVAAGVLLADFCFSAKFSDLPNQVIDGGLCAGCRRGGRMTTSPCLRMVTVLLPLETSIPIAFIEDTPTMD